MKRKNLFILLGLMLCLMALPLYAEEYDFDCSKNCEQKVAECRSEKGEVKECEDLDGQCADKCNAQRERQQWEQDPALLQILLQKEREQRMKQEEEERKKEEAEQQKVIFTSPGNLGGDSQNGEKPQESPPSGQQPENRQRQEQASPSGQPYLSDQPRLLKPSEL